MFAATERRRSAPGGGKTLESVDLDRGGFACALGGPGRDTLFIVATESTGLDGMFEGPRPRSC
jgi:sugar lactone lactonase YvrE